MLVSTRIAMAAAALSLVFSAGTATSRAEAVLHEQSQLGNGAYQISRTHQAQDFYLSTPARITSISVWLAEINSPGTDNGQIEGLSSLSWRLYGDAAGKPGPMLASGQDYDPFKFDEPVTFPFGGDILRVDIPINVDARRRGVYWFALHPYEWEFATNVLVGWLTTTPGFGSGHYIDRIDVPGVAWEGPYSEEAFRVLGVRLPEPSGTVLAIAAVLAGVPSVRTMRER